MNVADLVLIVCVAGSPFWILMIGAAIVSYEIIKSRRDSA